MRRDGSRDVCRRLCKKMRKGGREGRGDFVFRRTVTSVDEPDDGMSVVCSRREGAEAARPSYLTHS